MKIKSVSTEPDVRIEIVPLIDVIFCILTFFILAAVTLTRQNAINVDLPAASTGVTQMREILVVSVDPVGQIFVEKSPVTENQLLQVLQDFRLARPQGLMVLYASRLSSYNDVVRVLDLLRSVGGDRVALATLDAENSEPTPTFNFDPLNPGLPANPGLEPLPGTPANPGAAPLPGPDSPAAPLPGLDSPLFQPNPAAPPSP